VKRFDIAREGVFNVWGSFHYISSMFDYDNLIRPICFRRMPWYQIC